MASDFNIATAGAIRPLVIQEWVFYMPVLENGLAWDCLFVSVIRECPALVRVIMHNRIPMPLMRLCWALYQCPERFVQTNKSVSDRTGRKKHYPSSASCRLLCGRWKDPILVLFSIASP